MNWHLSRRCLACLFCVVVFCVFFGWFAFGVGFWFVRGDFVTAYWTMYWSSTSSLLGPLNLQTAMCMHELAN